mgnify:CR=1 FL=1
MNTLKRLGENHNIQFILIVAKLVSELTIILGLFLFFFIVVYRAFG